MAIIILYKDLEQNQTFGNNQLKATNKATNIQFIEYLDQIGTFEFSISANDSFCQHLKDGYIIGIDGTYYGIITKITQFVQSNKNEILVTGVDLKGYLSRRITLYPQTAIQSGLQGYDAIKDVSTETIVKYFINNNIVNPSNKLRKIEGFTIAQDKNRGLQNDRYMSRFEPLDELLYKNLNTQHMGYKVDIDLINNTFIFDVILGKDRTSIQRDNNPIIFDVKLKNILSLEYFLSNQNYKNIFYSTLSNSSKNEEAMTCMYYDGDDESQGSRRFEQHLNVSVNLPDNDLYDNLKKYALKDASSYIKEESLTAFVTNKYKYNTDYFLGDFVTIILNSGLFVEQIAVLDVQITQITHKWGQNEILREVGFGKGKLTKFEVIKRNIRNGGA